MKKMLLLFALSLSIGMQAAWAQTKAKGRVTDDKGEGLPGASVKVSGTTTGTITDFDGNFEIDVPEGAQVIIAAMGYDEKKLNPDGNMKVSMSHGDNILTEVSVVQPYGPAITKEKYVGAADVITSKQIEKMPVSDFTKALEGAAPGLQITNGGGQPGSGSSIRIRGVGSLSGGNSPLIVVDGNAYDGDLTSINPGDIENVTVLKDAVSTSQYGSRGSNGVIVVTTKRGRRGEAPKIFVDGKVGTITRALPNYDMMTDPKDYYEAAWGSLYNRLITSVTNGRRPPTDAEKKTAGEAASGLSGEGIVDQLGYNSYRIPGVDPSIQNAMLLDPVTGKLNPNAQLRYQDDWVKEMQRTGVRQDYNLSVSGGSENTDYYLSAGYLKEKGFMLNTDYDRFTSRLNVNSRATEWATVGMNLAATMSTQNGLSSNSGLSSQNPTYIASATPPIFPVYYRDSNDNKVLDPYTGKDKYDYGSIALDPDFSMGDRASTANSNVIGQMLLNENKARTKNIIFSPYFEARFLKDFTFRTNLTSNYTNVDQTNWVTSLHGQFKAQKGQLFLANNNYFNYSWNQNLNWHHNFNETHDLSLTLVHENYYYQTHQTNGSNTGFPGESFRDLAVATGIQSVSSATYDERLESYLAVANYAYKGKYLFSGNVRRDGLSRFHPDSRWGTFYAIGGAWILSEENFMKDVSWISNLKLKASYGTQGNKDVLATDGSQNYYAWQGLYDLSRPNGANTAPIPVSLTNAALKWESSKQVNLGLEFTMFNQRLSGELNVFSRSNTALYYNVPNAPSTAFRNKLINAADVTNKGVELNLFITAVQTRNFSWKVNANFTSFKNTINKLADGVDSSIQSVTMWKKGHGIYDYYLAHSSGVDPTNGDELYSYIDANGNTRDTNNYVFAVNNGSRQYTGSSAIPKLSGAITNSFTYKSFELSFLISYGIGGKYYDGTYQRAMTAGSTVGSTNYHVDAKNSWTPENTGASLPRMELANVNIGQASDRWLVSGSYLNIRNIALSYSLPANIAGKAHMKSVAINLAVDNVALFSARKGLNPQNSFSGVSDYVYVPGRTIIAGIRLGL